MPLLEGLFGTAASPSSLMSVVWAEFAKLDGQQENVLMSTLLGIRELLAFVDCIRECPALRDA